MSCCFSCGAELPIQSRPGRGESCTKCGTDIKVCRNCRFYDAKSYNECAEPNAERVVEKERANFCEYFTLTDKSVKEPGSSSDPMEELKRLFGDK